MKSAPFFRLSQQTMSYRIAFISKNAGTCMAVAVLLATSGCGSDVDRVNLTGNATFAGQPIVFGVVKFVPDSAKNHKGPAGTAEIVDGKYDTALEGGSGIVPGPHLVRVTAHEMRPLEVVDETLPALDSPPLFFNYVIETDLQGGTFDIDVPEEARGYGVGEVDGQAAPPQNIP